MRVRVLFQGILAEWIGVQQREVDLPEESKFIDLCRQLRKLWGSKTPGQLWDEERNSFSPLVWAMRDKERLADLQAQLKDGEEITFLVGLAGG